MGTAGNHLIPTTIYIPTKSNEGVPFMRSQYEAFENQLVARGFGVSLEIGRIRGIWQDEHGVTFRDKSRQYSVAISSWRDVATLIEVIDWACAQFEQEAIFATINGVPEIFTPVPP